MRTRLPRRYVNPKCLLIGQKKIERPKLKGIVAHTRKRKNKGLDKFVKSVETEETTNIK